MISFHRIQAYQVCIPTVHMPDFYVKAVRSRQMEGRVNWQMDRFIIITNQKKDKDYAVTNRIAAYIREAGRHVILSRLDNIDKDLRTADAATGCDCAIVLGGDGTIIRTAINLLSFGIPILGVNLGTLGFLAEIEEQNVREALDRLFQNDYRIESRLLLSGEILSSGRQYKCNFPSVEFQNIDLPIGDSDFSTGKLPKGDVDIPKEDVDIPKGDVVFSSGDIDIPSGDGKLSTVKFPMEELQGYALNDIVIARKGLSRIISLGIYVNDELVDNFKGDGVIISTPTGSTAYNLSAGGPIINPRAEVFVITPVCPHSLSPRSIVVSAGDTIRVIVGKTRRTQESEATATYDGRKVVDMGSGDSVIIRKAAYETKLIKLDQTGFYEILRSKLVDNED